MPAEGQVFSGAPPQGELLQRVRGGAGDSILPLMGHHSVVVTGWGGNSPAPEKPSPLPPATLVMPRVSIFNWGT